MPWWLRRDGDGNVQVDSRALADVPAPGSAVWSGPLTPHTLVITVEQKHLPDDSARLS
jgi:hypothetical protein